MTPPFESVPILGVPINRLDFDQTMAELERFVARGRATGRSHHVVTANTDILVHGNADPELRAVLQGADLVVADGMPLVWASKFLAAELPERVAGSDIVPAMGEWSVRHRRRVMFYGGAADSAAVAADLVRRTSPEADIVSDTGMIDPDGTAAPEILETIRDAAPDVLCIGVAFPKAEWFIRRYADSLGVPVIIGTGASFDFLSGQQQRAPGWMQSAGLEWLYRMAKDPRRLVKRYGRDAVVFFPAIWRQLRLLRSADSTAVEIVVGEGDRVDVSGLGVVDAATAVRLATVAAEARDRDARATLVGVNDDLARSLEALSIDGLFDLEPG